MVSACYGRPPQHRAPDRVSRRGRVRPRLPLPRPAGRAGAQAGEGDGRPQDRLRLARLRARTSTSSTSRRSDRDAAAAARGRSSPSSRDYLSEHARREGYALLSTPRVLLEEDEDLDVGEFGIATRMVQRQRSDGGAPRRRRATRPRLAARRPAPSRRDEDLQAAAPRRPRPCPPADAEELGLARAPARSRRRQAPRARRTTVIGRSRECDITVDDPNISRRHAEIRREDGAYWIVDLGSTNGIEVNGRRVDRAKLGHDDRIVFGRTDASLREPVLGARPQVEPVLLGLKAAFLVLLYLFIWRVVRAASRDLPAAPQESFVFATGAGPRQARARRPALAPGRLVVAAPAIDVGRPRAGPRADHLRPRGRQPRRRSPRRLRLRPPRPGRDRRATASGSSTSTPRTARA